MFKKIMITIALVATIGVLVYGAVNRTLAKDGNFSEVPARSDSGGNTAGGESQYGNGNGNRGGNTGQQQADDTATAVQGDYGNGHGAGEPNAEAWNTLPAADPGDLSAEEAAALAYMREEEKLAHDVYVKLYEFWGLPIFQNISQSEQTHTDSMEVLLDRYELADPAVETAGVFTNPDLQALYNDLVAQGSESLAAALKVGAAIEEIDILDLQARLALTDQADIQQVFANLLAGSENHLRAFTTTLKNQTGEIYQAQYMSSAAYQEIVSASMGDGGKGGGQGSGRRGNRP
jgi:hypothetical protein